VRTDNPGEVRKLARVPYPERLPDAISRLPVPLNVFKMLSHAPDLVEPTADLGVRLLNRSSLAPAVRELLIMTVADHTACAYEAVQHTPMALHAGATREQLDAITEHADRATHFDAGETAALAVADDLLATGTIAPKTFRTARPHYSERQITEMIMTVGYDTMIAGLLNGLDVEIDSWRYQPPAPPP
jgi:4-carboxymuconolactone decarboxylase